MATIQTNVVREYKDLDLSFNIHPVKKDINKLTGELAVINSLKNIISTNHYEKPFNPNFGSNLRRLLFENSNGLTSTLIEREITDAVQNYEPRVNLSKVEVAANTEETGFNVTIEFFVVNRTDPITINFFLERVR